MKNRNLVASICVPYARGSVARGGYDAGAIYVKVGIIDACTRPVIAVLVETPHSLDDKIAVLDAEIARRAEEDEEARRAPRR